MHLVEAPPKSAAFAEPLDAININNAKPSSARAEVSKANGALAGSHFTHLESRSPL
jgi:hypothetical protein